MQRPTQPEQWRKLGEIAAIGLLGLALATLLLKNLAYPLMWQDEAETAVFAQRILEYGYPKVHGPRNVIYEFGSNVAHGIDERTDAYIGTTWGHFYFAIPGIVWAAAVEDPYAKTWRVRLPFALAGALAIALFGAAVTPIFGGAASRRRWFWIGYLALSCGSISLLLHLREVRYYPLSMLLMGGIAWLHLRHVVFETLGRWRYSVGLALLLLLLFNVFYSAYFVVGFLLGVEAIWRGAARAREAGTAPGREIIRTLAPLLASAVCVAPLLVFFETFSVAAEFSDHLGWTPAGYLSNLQTLGSHLWRHELLTLAIACRVAVAALDRLQTSALEPWESKSRRVVHGLGGFALGYALLGCINPLAYERYFIVLSPVLTIVFVLDAMSLAALAASSYGPRVRSVTLVAIVLVTAFGNGIRIDDLRGRLREISDPVRGPLDYVIPWIRRKYPDPKALVIATNYENHPYIYYLGSHTIVGLSRNNIRRERMLVPDLVVPRRRWSASLNDAMDFVRRGGYRSELFPVRDLHYNNIPALTRSASTPDPHRFVTALAERDEQKLEVYVRIATEPGPR